MKDIFDLQWKLNIHTMRNIGVDFLEVMEDKDLKAVWIENYRRALSAELAELVREVRENGIGSANGKIEIIDILHFLVSLSHMVHIRPSDLDPLQSPLHGPSAFEPCVIRTFLALDDLQNSLKWKWWAKGGGFKAEKAKEAVLELWDCFDEFCALFHLDFGTIKAIYTAKNQVNFKRQEENYNEDTKTEADNLSIQL